VRNGWNNSLARNFAADGGRLLQAAETPSISVAGMSIPNRTHPARSDRRARVTPAGAGVGPGADRNAANARPNGERASNDPVELYTGLAATAVPALCDGLRLQFATADGATFDVSYPSGERGAAADLAPDAQDGLHGNDGVHVSDGEARTSYFTGPGRIVVAVRSEPVAGEPAVAGTVTCTWRDHDRPSEHDVAVAGIVASQAVSRYRIASLAIALHEQRSRSANLEEALATNREIGQAIGILMATDHLTAAQAFDALRTASQHSHRKLRAIAADVVETGVLSEVAAPTGGLAPMGVS
jgi:hypothetical protein